MFNPKIPYNQLPLLPGQFNYDQVDILKETIKANNALSKLNGLALLLPNTDVLITPLLTKESVESNAIENINTTTLNALQAGALNIESVAGADKEAIHYKEAILYGLKQIKTKKVITTDLLIRLQNILEPQKYGVRNQPGTVIGNSLGEILYTPPQGEAIILNLLGNLEKFINMDNDEVDTLIKMPIVHYQFEAIHPFYDGNGRTGRILNILYFILTEKLDFPILFLSEYINQNKAIYYNLLRETTTTGDYTAFILFMLDGLQKQALQTQNRVIAISDLLITVQAKLAEL